MIDDFTPPRYCVSVEITDNESSDELIVNEGFNTPKLIYAIEALEKIINQLKKENEGQ